MVGQVVEEEQKGHLGGQIGIEYGAQSITGREIKERSGFVDALAGYQPLEHSLAHQLGCLAGLAQTCAAHDEQAAVGVQVGPAAHPAVDPVDLSPAAQATTELFRWDGPQGFCQPGRLPASLPRPRKEKGQHPVEEDEEDVDNGAQN